MKKIVCLFLVAVSLFASSVGCAGKKGKGNYSQKNIAQVDQMPDRASNYKLIDFKAKAEEADRILYDFANSEENQPYNRETMGPIGFWDDRSFPGTRYFGFPSYIAGPNRGQGGQEGLCVLASLWASSAIGIDKSAQKFGDKTYNFIEMSKMFLGNEPNNFILDNIRGRTGQTFWYEIYPQLLFIHLHEMYPDETWMEEIILTGAEKWHNALPYFKDYNGNVSFEFKSFDFSVNKPLIGSDWNEPPNGGLAMIFYYAYMLSGNAEYLDDVKFVLDYLQKWEKNPYYEIMQNYAPYVAAIMNAYHGTNYDVQKFANSAFECGSDFNGSAGIVNSKWGDYDAYGLFAFEYNQSTGSGYAFAMETWHLAAMLALTARYDPRFADDIGKYFMHMANSSRLFYGDELPAENQSCSVAPCDPNRAIAYEGVRTAYGKISPYAMGDQLSKGWGGDTDYGIYGGVHVGLMASIIEKTEIDEILRVNLSRLDTLRTGNEEFFLYYNPYDEKKTVNLEVTGTKKLYNTVTAAVIAKSASGKVKIEIPAKSSVIVAVLPADAEITEKDGYVYSNGVVIANRRPAVNVLTPEKPKRALTSKTKVTFSFEERPGDKIVNMTVTLGGKELYSGKPITELEIGNPSMEKGVYNLVAEVKTASGLKDIAMQRVRKM
ncbi:MAG: hypothetical protein J6Z34_04275 [Clostridia bacterium]|nr:hypothetical protein [Clostridia bacterium]